MTWWWKVEMGEGMAKVTYMQIPVKGGKKKDIRVVCVP